MAVMTDPQRAALAADLMRAISNDREACPVLKAQLRAAVDAADTWASDNAASYNTALPAPFRTSASAAQKSRLLEAVIIRRRAVGA
jgi:hypothetical protein